MIRSVALSTCGLKSLLCVALLLVVYCVHSTTALRTRSKVVGCHYWSLKLLWRVVALFQGMQRRDFLLTRCYILRLGCFQMGSRWKDLRDVLFKLEHFFSRVQIYTIEGVVVGDIICLIRMLLRPLNYNRLVLSWSYIGSTGCNSKFSLLNYAQCCSCSDALL